MSSSPIVDRIRIIPRPDDFLDRNVGSSGEVFFNRNTNSLRVYSGKDRGGFEIAKTDLSNITNAVFAAKAAAAGIGSGNTDSGTSISVSSAAPTNPENGNLWLNTENGFLYVYVNDGSSSQWIQPAVPSAPLPQLSLVAFTGNYNDLTNKPIIGGNGFSGSYNDLSDKPDLFSGNYDDLTNKPTLFSGNYDDLTNKPTSFSNLTLIGATTLQQTTEVVTAFSGATGTYAHNYSNGAVFYHSGILSNFTANFTNVPTTNNRSVSVVMILSQGATPYIPSSILLNDSAVTVQWIDGIAPTGTANQTDIISLTFIRVNSQWQAIGSFATYNEV